MWTCANCEEELEDGFDSCWQCGAHRDGTPPPDDFLTRDHSPDPLATAIADRFKCSKCAHSDAYVKRIATTGTGLSRLIDVQHNTFIAVSCSHCGYTELFNADVLEKKDGLSILDLLFG